MSVKRVYVEKTGVCRKGRRASRGDQQLSEHRHRDGGPCIDPL